MKGLWGISFQHCRALCRKRFGVVIGCKQQDHWDNCRIFGSLAALICLWIVWVSSLVVITVNEPVKVVDKLLVTAKILPRQVKDLILTWHVFKIHTFILIVWYLILFVRYQRVIHLQSVKQTLYFRDYSSRALNKINIIWVEHYVNTFRYPLQSKSFKQRFQQRSLSMQSR